MTFSSMSAPALQFVLTLKSLKNVLDFFGNKDGSVKIGNSIIKVSKELIIFVSINIYSHFRSDSEYSFDINLGTVASESEVAECVKKYLSLSDGAEFVQIEERELPIIRIIRENMMEGQIDLPTEGSWPKIFRWTSKCLSDFQSIANCDEFHFNVCDKDLQCPTVLAMLLSQEVFRRKMADSATSSMELSLPDGFEKNDYVEAFGKVFDLLSGNVLTIPVEKVRVYEEIAKEIDNDELLSAIEGLQSAPICFSNIYEYLRILRIGDQSNRLNETIEFAAVNFYQLRTEDLLKIPLQIIQKVLSSPHLRIENEGKLFDFAKLYIKRNGEKNVGILSKIKFEHLDSQKMAEIKDVFSPSSMNGDLCSAFYNRLIREVDSPENESEKQRWISQKGSKIASMRAENQRLKEENQRLKEENHALNQNDEDKLNQIRVQMNNIHAIESQSHELTQMVEELQTQMQYQRNIYEERNKTFLSQFEVSCGELVSFKSMRNNESIEIIEGITKIKKEAFKDANIQNVRLPSTLNEIGDGAFMGCASLSSITIPNGVAKIGENAFYGCSSLSSIVIPPSVTLISKGTFDYCSSLNSVMIPTSVNAISDMAFHYCKSLSSIIIPQSVSQIGISAFSACCSLTSIIIPPNVTQIEYSTFHGCSSLSSIEIPPNLTKIDRWAFYGCSSLRSVTIPIQCEFKENEQFNSFENTTDIIKR